MRKQIYKGSVKTFRNGDKRIAVPDVNCLSDSDGFELEEEIEMIFYLDYTLSSMRTPTWIDWQNIEQWFWIILNTQLYKNTIGWFLGNLKTQPPVPFSSEKRPSAMIFKKHKILTFEYNGQELLSYDFYE